MVGYPLATLYIAKGSEVYPSQSMNDPISSKDASRSEVNNGKLSH